MKKTIVLILILSLAIFTRFWNISHLPPSLFSDEVDAGYQAMVFNQNQTDYFANKLPIHFHSFSDWRTSGLIYFIALFQRLGVDPSLSVRLPSALFSVMSVFVIFLITKSIIPAFLMALSPWAIHYGRTGFEVSGMILVILLGIYFFQKFVSSPRFLFLYLSIFFFCLSPYFYSTANLFLIFVPILLYIAYKKDLKFLRSRLIITPLIFFLLLLSPLIYDTLVGKSGYRFSYISIFTQPHLEQITDNNRYQDALVDHPGEIGVKTTLVSKILHSKYQLMVQKFLTNYFQSFSTEFLFLKGDSNIRHGFGEHGLLYLIDFPLLLFGLFIFFKKPDKLGNLFLLMLIFTPIPFSLTRDSNSAHATRLILMLPSLIYFSYLGIKTFFSKYKIILWPIFIIYILSFLSFWHYYNYHYPQNSARDWHTGMKEAVLATNGITNSPLVFSSSYEPFLPFFIFYRPYQLAQNSSVSQHLTQLSNSSFNGQVLDGKYYFGKINWNNLNLIPASSVLIIPKSEYDSDTLSNFHTLKFINKTYINQEEFYILQSK